MLMRIAFVVAAVVGGVVLGPASAAQSAEKLEVIADEAKIVVGDKVLATVKKGDKLDRVRWVAVELRRDGKVIRGWVRAEAVAVVGTGKAPVLPPEPTLGEKHTIHSHAQRIKLLEMVFRTPSAWSTHRFTTSTKPKGNVTLTGKQIDRLRKVINARGTWPAKLNVMAHVTPLDIRVYCDPDGMVPIKQVTDAFGQPDETEKGVICNIVKFNPRPVEAARGKTNMMGTWYRYGSIRLGVTDQDEILVVQVFGPQWRDERKRWQAADGKRASGPQ